MAACDFIARCPSHQIQIFTHKCLRGQAGRDTQDLDERSTLRRIHLPKYDGGRTQGIEISRDFDVSNLLLPSETRGLEVTLVPVAGIAETPRGLSLRVRQIYLRRDR